MLSESKITSGISPPLGPWAIVVTIWTQPCTNVTDVHTANFRGTLKSWQEMQHSLQLRNENVLSCFCLQKSIQSLKCSPGPPIHLQEAITALLCLALKNSSIPHLQDRNMPVVWTRELYSLQKVTCYCLFRGSSLGRLMYAGHSVLLLSTVCSDVTREWNPLYWQPAEWFLIRLHSPILWAHPKCW